MYKNAKKWEGLIWLEIPIILYFWKKFGQNSHFYIHGINWRNLTDLNKVKEILPWITENLTKLGL